MTEEQFQTLAKYEDTFDKALHQGRAPYPGRAVIESFLAVIRSTNPRYKTNLNCGVCVLHLVQDAGRMYFGEKKDRERLAAEQAAKEAQAECVADSGKTSGEPAPKKTRKKKESAE